MDGPAPIFRLATIDDVPLLHALIERAYRGESAKAGWTHEADLLEDPRSDISSLTQVVGAPGERLFVARSGDEMVGCVQLSQRPHDTAYLGLLTVDPARQAAGVGRRILAQAEIAAVRKFGAQTIELTAISLRPELIAYYERRGYRQTGESRPFPDRTDPPLTLIVMAKPLPSATGIVTA